MRFLPFAKGKKGFQFAGGGVSDSGGSGGGGGSYTLPPATSSTLGGVKIGSGVNVTSDGTISVSGGGGGGGGFDYSTSEEVNTGHKWIDGKSIFCKVYYIPNQVNLNSTGYTTIISDANLKNVDTPIDYTITAAAMDIYRSAFPFGAYRRFEVNKYAGTFQGTTTSGTDYIWAQSWIILYYTKA